MNVSDSFIAQSDDMRRILALVAAYADAPVIVLVGETGTGKTHLARLIYAASGRTGELIIASGSELNGPLGEDLLFGHDAEAFTGATRQRRGLLESAAGGFLFLDDFDNLKRRSQLRLLRPLDAERKYRRLGTNVDLRVQAHLIVGLHECPDVLVNRGILIPDVRWRLGDCVIRLARLAQRGEEIDHLVREFLGRLARDLGPGPVVVSAEAMGVLRSWSWPGNARELAKALEPAYLLSRYEGCEAIGVEHLPERFRQAPRAHAQRNGGSRGRRLKVSADQVRTVMREVRGDRAEAARRLGVTERTVRRRMAEAG